jgi:hypothetical protein
MDLHILNRSWFGPTPFLPLPRNAAHMSRRTMCHVQRTGPKKTVTKHTPEENHGGFAREPSPEDHSDAVAGSDQQALSHGNKTGPQHVTPLMQEIFREYDHKKATKWYCYINPAKSAGCHSGNEI